MKKAKELWKLYFHKNGNYWRRIKSGAWAVTYIFIYGIGFFNI